MVLLKYWFGCNICVMWVILSQFCNYTIEFYPSFAVKLASLLFYVALQG